jgi:polyisoprenoid-binding protein YceI
MRLESWQIDPAHSTVGFTVRHLVISKVRGRFTRWTARLKLETADLGHASVEVELEAASIDTGVAERDAHLRSPDFLDAAVHPALHYRSRKVELAQAGHLRVFGDLTVRGVTRPVDLEVDYVGRVKDPWGGVRAGFSATASLNRKDFGLGWNQALEAGGVLVADRVDVEIELEALLQAATQAA